MDDIDPKLDTNNKALRINLDTGRYGTFAEIGAGQEVARCFFRVGGAANTVAKTMSAYDMSVSDAIYGATDRYVSRRRLKAMLDYEYGLLLERLQKKRGGKTSFFVFADTVATRKEEGSGWMGIRFQPEVGARPSEILLHVRMLDRETVRQQEALGVLGVNLLYGAFYLHNRPDLLVNSLLDNLTWERVEVDMIQFSGPTFADVDNRLMALQLVKSGITEAAMFSSRGEAMQWSEALHNKPVFIQRGNFGPVTTASVDVLERGLEQFMKEPEIDGEQPVVLMELTLRHLTAGDVIDEKDFLSRADLLAALGRTAFVSNFRRFHRLAWYVSRYTRRPIGLAIGASKLAEIFDESFYNEKEGGLLGGLGQLFKNPAWIYVYPSSMMVPGRIVTAANFEVKPRLRHLYQHLRENRHIQDILNYNEDLLDIGRLQVLDMIRRGDPAWEKLCPPPVVRVIKEEKLFI